MTMKRGRQDMPDLYVFESRELTHHPVGTWAADEHDRFLEAMRLHPRGPWKAIADHVRTRSVRQVQSHAQKYQEKLVRRQRGLRKPKLADSAAGEAPAVVVEVGHRLEMGTLGKLQRDHDDPTDQRGNNPAKRPQRGRPRKNSTPRSTKEPLRSNDPSHPSSSNNLNRTSSRCPSSGLGSDVDPQLETGVSAFPSHPTTPLNSPSMISGPHRLVVTMSPIMTEPLVRLPMVTWAQHSNAQEALKPLPYEPAALPTLGESLDFFIQYLSIRNITTGHP